MENDDIDKTGLIRAIARRFALPSDDALVLDRGMNFSIHFRPLPLVARVTRVTQLVRPITALAGAVSLAKSLGDLVVPPSDIVEPGPHLIDDRYLTFWSFVQGEAADAVEAGRSLRQLHEAAVGYPDALRSFDPRVDVLAIADLVGGKAGEILKRAARQLSFPSMPQQAIHGDAHIGNVLRGGRWMDPDDMCLGPREWDVACLSHLAAFWDEMTAETDEALRAYGSYDKASVEALRPLVVLYTAAWGSMAPFVRDAVTARTERRLEWLSDNV